MGKPACFDTIKEKGVVFPNLKEQILEISCFCRSTELIEAQ